LGAQIFTGFIALKIPKTANILQKPSLHLQGEYVKIEKYNVLRAEPVGGFQYGNTIMA
jgi:hypothetical protein